MNQFQLDVFMCMLIGLASAGLGTASAASVYVGLGDSITFGETDLSYTPSYGNRGYVADFANTLAARNGGIAPMVVDLAIDGETTASFMSGSGRTTPVVGRTDAQLAAQNLNYTNSPSTPQADMFKSLVASEMAAGNTISTISITLGFNELGSLASLPTSQALAMLPSTLATYQTNYTNILTHIRSLEPEVNLYMLGYYNPFPADPTNPAAPIFAKMRAGAEYNYPDVGKRIQCNVREHQSRLRRERGSIDVSRPISSRFYLSGSGFGYRTNWECPSERSRIRGDCK